MNSPRGDEPSVTIVIAVLNEAAHLPVLLSQIEAQTYPHDRMNVVIADGGSTDGTLEAVKDFLSEPRTVSMRVLQNPARVPAAGFNLAIREINTDALQLLGAHAEIPQDFVERCVDLLEVSKADAVGGRIQTVGRGATGRAIAKAMSSSFGVGGVQFRRDRVPGGNVDTVPFGLYRRSVFEAVGEFDESLVGAEDDEFNFRMTRAGLTIWLDPSISTVYFCRSTYRGLYAQYRGYGFGKAGVLKKHGALPSARAVVPSVLVITLLLAASLSPWSGRARAVLGLTLGCYGLAAAGSACVADRRQAPRVALSYVAMHFGYGVGMLRGLLPERRM